ncbi:MAG: valine--tRNA ligase [Candidatus Wolfebacteria bacterium]|nr:valine--tRNA ligase [Candidatus Wolfebacteria bacterium]
MDEKFNKPYDPSETEEKIYKKWEKSGYFAPEAHQPMAGNPKPFCIIMPPPNANGSLHLGHALMTTLEDIMIRYKRMRGFKTLWLPGADHAGFETQVVYEKKLEKEGRSRFQIPREKLWQEIWDFTQANKVVMEEQLKRLGASCDWSRKKFTLDKDIIEKTQDTFIQMHKEGLIYRGNRLVNWCVKHQTGLSELETKHEERTDALYYIKYGPITVATVRPETIFGDTAVAVNPKDKRYKDLIGKEIEVDVAVGKINLKVIADKVVDIEFGTGAVKVTPAHDQTDFEIWQRHKEEIEGPKEVINHLGRIDLKNYFPKNEVYEKLQGLKVLEARKVIVEELQKKGLIEKIDNDYKHDVSLCYKCSNILEPRLMSQWFVKMEPLAKPAIKAVEKGDIKFIPTRFKKVYFHWLKNIRDWNISRQIVWGIPIPAWFCLDEIAKKGLLPQKEIEPDQSLTHWRKWLDFSTKPVFIGRNPPKKCPGCGKNDLIQDPDVFDTWFSSGQWPFLTLGFEESESPSKSKIKSQKSKLSDYEQFYPTDVMETGWDILFFWVARMVMLGLYKTKKVPFKHVYLHGLVRDKDKQKMSKSKGNVIDPLGIVNEYGADALRMALIIGNTPGNDLAFSEEKVRGYRNFANKIWQASRFVLMNTPRTNLHEFNHKLTRIKLSAYDKKRLKEFESLKKSVTKEMDSFKFYIAGEKIYHYFWHTFADKIIEESKERLNGEDAKEKQSAQFILLEILTGSLKLLHPFMPFITEEIYQYLPGKIKKTLMVENW